MGPCTLKLTFVVVIAAILIYGLRIYTKGSLCDATEQLNGKVTIITGANTGIGRANLVDFLKRGAKVYLACRNVQKAQAAVDEILKEQNGKVDAKNVAILPLDLSSQKSIRSFVREYKQRERNLDILVNNAGLMGAPFELSEDGYELTFAVNHLGHFLLTNLLLKELKASAPSRVVTVSSIGHHFGRFNLSDINNKDRSQMEHYADSKLMNILFTSHLSKLLEGTGVSTYSLHPGAVATELQRHYMLWVDYPIIRDVVSMAIEFLFKTPSEGAQTQICVSVSSKFSNDSGRYYNDNQEELPSESARSDEDAALLWTASEKMTNYKFPN